MDVFKEFHTTEILLVEYYFPYIQHVPIHQHCHDAIVKIFENLEEQHKTKYPPMKSHNKEHFSVPDGSLKKRISLLFKRGFQNWNLCRPQNHFQPIKKDFNYY